MRNAAHAVSEALPTATYRTLPGQTHLSRSPPSGNQGWSLIPFVLGFWSARPEIVTVGTSRIAS